MKALLLFVALIGSVCALQYPVEYHYKYSGRIATGIPSIRPQVSATGIRAKLILQMKTRTQGIAKLTNIEVGQYNGDATCVQLRQPIPIRYSPLQKYTALLQETFGVNFAEQTGHVMTVPKSDHEFITNIRKSVIEILRVRPIVENLSGISNDPIIRELNKDKDIKIFSEQEETIFGRCENQYTLTPIPEYLAQKENERIRKHLVKDQQKEGSSGRSSVPKIGDKLYRLVKAVDFDKCHEHVILMHSGVANMSKAGHGQFEAVQSRSSVATYILRGDGNNFRVEEAVVEGDLVLNPFGNKVNRLQAITNQTLLIESAEAISTPLRLPSNVRNVKTWRYEVASPFSPPSGSPKIWVNYYSKGDRLTPVPPMSYMIGIFPTPEISNRYKSAIMHLLEEIVNILEEIPKPVDSQTPHPMNHKGSMISSNLYTISKMMRSIHVKDVEEIFSHVFQQKDRKGEKKQMILVDVAAASGSAAPMKVLIEKMENGQISSTRAASVFITLTNHIVSPVVVPELMKYAMSMDIERKPFLTSAVLVNFAAMAHRVCLSHGSWNYSVPNPVYGKESCKPEQIISQFLPHLISKIRSSPKEWQKSIYVQSAAMLGTPHIISTLRPIITGKEHIPLKVRQIAIYGLFRNNMPASAREEVFDELMSVVDNLSENEIIRQTAMTVLYSWHPTPAWWQRMARLTWREPSQSTAAFFASTVEKLALSTDPRLKKQANIAAFVLPLMKPFSPSMKYSNNYIYSRFDPISKMAIEAQTVYIENPESMIPFDLFGGVKGIFGGVKVDMLELALSSQGLQEPMSQMMNIFRMHQREEGQDYPSYPIYNREPSSRQAQQVLERTMKEARPEAGNYGEPELNIYMKAFDNIISYLPITADTIMKVAGEEGENLLSKLIKGHKVHTTKYFNPSESQYFVPTEIGLPVVASVAMPTINYGEGEVKIEIEGVSGQPKISDILRARNVQLLFKTNYRLMSKLSTNISVPVPWEDSIIETGVESFKEINLPVYGNLSIISTPEIKNVTLNLAPFTEQPFPVFHAHNIPFTAIRPLSPLSSKPTDYKVLSVDKERKTLLNIEKTISKRATGLKANLKYNADVPYPFNKAFFFDYVRQPQLLMRLLGSPTTKQWQLSMNLFPRESETKNVSLSLSYLSPSGGSSEPMMSSDRENQRNVLADFDKYEDNNKYDKMRDSDRENQRNVLADFDKYEDNNKYDKMRDSDRYQDQEENQYEKQMYSRHQDQEENQYEKQMYSRSENEKDRESDSMRRQMYSGSSEGRLPDVSATDSMRQRIEKLKQMSTGSKVRAINVQLVLNGTEFRKYEVLAAFTRMNEGQSSMKKFKTMVALMSTPMQGSEPKAYCLDAEMETPRIESINELKQKVQSGMSESLKGNVYYGRSCSSKSIVNFQGHAKLSSERQRLVASELNHMCNYDQRDPVVELQTPAVYDEGRIDIEYRREEIPKPMMNITYQVEKFLEGIVWPLASYNKLAQNPEGKLSIQIQRPVSSKYYTVYAQKPKEDVIVNEIPVFDFLTRVVPFKGLEILPSRYSEIILAQQETTRCAIRPNEITTYDGMTFNYSPLNCYTVAAIRNSGEHDFIVHTRKYSSNVLEVRITLPNQNTVVELTKDRIMINGRPMTSSENTKEFKDTSGRVVMIVTKTPVPKVEIVGKMKITVENEIIIVPEYSMKGMLRGLCGDFDGRTKFDLTGPKECIFNDEELFKFAWTISDGENCNTNNLQKQKQRVLEFQNNCHKRPNSRSMITTFISEEEEDSSECYTHVYPIKHQSGSKSGICVTEEPVPKCKSQCKPIEKDNVERRAKCWESGKVPSDVVSQVSTGYSTYPVKAPADYSKTIQVDSVKTCKKN